MENEVAKAENPAKDRRSMVPPGFQAEMDERARRKTPPGFKTGHELTADATRLYDICEQSDRVSRELAYPETKWRKVKIHDQWDLMIPDYVPDPPPYGEGSQYEFGSYDSAAKKRRRRVIMVSLLAGLLPFLLIGLGIATDANWIDGDGIFFVLGSPFVFYIGQMICVSLSGKARKKRFDEWFDTYRMAVYTTYETKTDRG